MLHKSCDVWICAISVVTLPKLQVTLYLVKFKSDIDFSCSFCVHCHKTVANLFWHYPFVKLFGKMSVILLYKTLTVILFWEYVSLEHKSSHKQHRYVCSNSQQYIVWVKIIHFYFMPKIIRILRSCSMKISKLNFWLVICIAKNFIWTTLKMIFSIFRFFCTLRFQIYKYCQIITNHTSMEIWFIQLSDLNWISTGFVIQGHIFIWYLRE